MFRISQLYHQTVQFMAGKGLGHVSRTLREGQPCILTFHGLRADDDPGLLDPDLHTPVSLFREICRHLASQYDVRPLSEITMALQNRLPLPDRTVAITFDDGYASNYLLAYPILKEFGLTATIFVTSGFVDRTHRLWFHRLESACASAGKDHAAAAAIIKQLPQEKVDAEVSRLEKEWGIRSDATTEVPAIFQPITWDQVREMHASGLIEFGAHTRRHLILGRCDADTAMAEIEHSRDRLTTETGLRPTLFAYPNGQPGDYTAETVRLMRAAGFHAAVTMSPGFVEPTCGLFEIPRYGAPMSVAETEATVSGAFETLKAWRLATREALAA